jgi:hypothetical protein
MFHMRDFRLKKDIAYLSGDIAEGEVRKLFSSQFALVMKVDLHDQLYV